MKHRSLAVAGIVASALTAGCISSTDIGDPRPFSFIDVREIPTENGTALTPLATAIFIKDRVSGVVPSYALNEGCDMPSAITIDSGEISTPSGVNLDPGSVSMVVKGTVDTTTRTVQLTPQNVANGLVQYINSSRPVLTPGTDSIRVEVTGAAGGFPAFGIRTASVAPFVAQPVDDSIVGQGIRVQWTGLSPSSPTRMQIALQYSDGTNSDPDREVRCIAIDDGDFTIPRQYLTEWQEAGVDSTHRVRQVVMSRFNTVGSNIADGIAVIVTRIDTTLIKPQ